MVNVGLRAYIWHHHKEAEQRTAREVWQLNGYTYHAYRAWIEHVKGNGFPEQQLMGQTSGSANGKAQREGPSTAETSPYTFKGMAAIFDSGASPVVVVHFSAASPSWVAWGSADGSVRIADGASNLALKHELFDHKTAVLSLSSSLDGSLLLSAAHDGGVCLWQADTGILVRTFLLSGCAASGCCFHQYNPNFVMIGTSLGEIRVLNCSVGTTQEQVRLSPKARSITAMTTAGDLLFIADSNGAVYTLRCVIRGSIMRPLQKLARLAVPGLQGSGAASLMYTGISSLAQGPGLLVSSASDEVCLLRVSTQTGALEVIARAPCPVSARRITAKFCPDSSFDGPEYMSMGGEDTEVHIYALSGSTLREANRIQGHLAPVTDTSWSSDGRMLASCDSAGVVILWQRQEARTNT